ncbi:hypothetical protein Bca101_042433 [Brassica carinata]
MANARFGPHLPSVLEGGDIENIYEYWGVDYVVELYAPLPEETPENVRPDHCIAYMHHFRDGGLSFPLPHLEALAELRMAFPQMSPNFWPYFLTTWIRVREKDLKFGLDELKQLYTRKQNNGFPGMRILALRDGRTIIEGIPNRDTNWRENYFVFKINPASVGDFDFSRIPMDWNDDINRFGAALMTLELPGMIEVLRRGSPRWLAFTPERIRAAYALPPGQNRTPSVELAVQVCPRVIRRHKRVRSPEASPEHSDASSEADPTGPSSKVQRDPTLRSRSQVQTRVVPVTPVSIAVPAADRQEALNPSVGGRDLEDDVDSSTHRNRHEILGEIGLGSSSLGIPPHDPGADPSKAYPAPLSPLAFFHAEDMSILEDPERLALVWRKIRSTECKLPSLDRMQARDAYIRMAVANAEAMKPSNEYMDLMEKRLAEFPDKEEIRKHHLTIHQLRTELDSVRLRDERNAEEILGLNERLMLSERGRVALQGNLDLMKRKWKREAENRNALIRKKHRLARSSPSEKYAAVLATVKAKALKKKEEVAAEIRLQDVRAHIGALTEYMEGGFVIKEELARLKGKETSCDIDYGLETVSDTSLDRLDLSAVSKESIYQDSE